MKTTTQLGLAMGILFALSTSVQAATHWLPPRTQPTQLRTVPGTTPDMLNRSVKKGSARQVEFAHANRIVPGASGAAVTRNIPFYPDRTTPVSPAAKAQFNIAPLK